MNRRGFGAIDLVLPLILVLLAVWVLVPELNRLLTDAKDSGVRGALGGLRVAISLSVANISIREDVSAGASTYPTVAELAKNKYSAGPPGNHVKLDGQSILDRSTQIPKNPWTDSAKVHDCTGRDKGFLLPGAEENDGWCYDEVKGVVWANSNLSDGPKKENEF